MLQPIANVKTLLIEGSCSSINCCHKGFSQSEACVNNQEILWETS